jgi:hypothetical protein
MVKTFHYQQTVLKAQNGVIENFWTIAPGDPSGKHKIEVYIDNRRIAAFEFEVVRLKQ